jgi:hypothetical protein
MRIVFVEIHNFRGIKKLAWAPAATVNCLIGPGDSTKTTILDAIELTLNPKPYLLADDSDFYDLDFNQQIKIIVTLAGLSPEFRSDDRYGMYLRGWKAQEAKIEDEPGDGLEDALSIRVVIDKSLEARWSIFNDRIDESESDPPTKMQSKSRPHDLVLLPSVILAGVASQFLRGSVNRPTISISNWQMLDGLPETPSAKEITKSSKKPHPVQRSSGSGSPYQYAKNMWQNWMFRE